VFPVLGTTQGRRTARLDAPTRGGQPNEDAESTRRVGAEHDPLHRPRCMSAADSAIWRQSSCADIAATRDARNDLLAALGKGQLPQEGPLRLRDAHERFIAAAGVRRRAQQARPALQVLRLGGHRRVPVQARAPQVRRSPP